MIETSDPNDTTNFRRVLGRFPSGLVIVTTRTGDKAYGLTCQAFTSVSLEPPLVGAFLTRDSGTLYAIDQTKRFTVSILAEDQIELARIFAISGADKFKDVAVIESPSGLPIIDGAIAWMECEVQTLFEAGDHIGLLAMVATMGCMGDSKPLVYWRGGYGELH